MRILIFLFLLAGCQSYDRSAHLVLLNRTDHPVYYWVSCDSNFSEITFSSNYLLKAHESVMPYLLYGPEGKGSNKNTWINAINRADDSALHVFYYYVDFKDHPDRWLTRSTTLLSGGATTRWIPLKVSLGWRLEYH